MSWLRISKRSEILIALGVFVYFHAASRKVSSGDSIELWNQPLSKSFHAIAGSGFCANSDGEDSYARRFESIDCAYAGASCENDSSCVGFACTDKHNLSVLYTISGCTVDCDKTAWLGDPGLIVKAIGRSSQPYWNDATCHVVTKASQDIVLQGDFSSVVTDQAQFLQECSTELVPATCVNVGSGSIVLTVGGGSQAVVEAATSQIATEGLDLPSFAPLKASTTTTTTTTCLLATQNPPETDRTYSRIHLGKSQSMLESTGCWATTTHGGDWMQIDLGSLKEVGGVATQGGFPGGCGTVHWVSKFSVKTSSDGSSWSDIQGEFSMGPYDVNSVWHPGIIARYVRLMVQGWHGAPKMRAGVLTCEATTTS